MGGARRQGFLHAGGRGGAGASPQVSGLEIGLVFCLPLGTDHLPSTSSYALLGGGGSGVQVTLSRTRGGQGTSILVGILWLWHDSNPIQINSFLFYPGKKKEKKSCYIYFLETLRGAVGDVSKFCLVLVRGSRPPPRWGAHRWGAHWEAQVPRPIVSPSPLPTRKNGEAG